MFIPLVAMTIRGSYSTISAPITGAPKRSLLENVRVNLRLTQISGNELVGGLHPLPGSGDASPTEARISTDSSP